MTTSVVLPSLSINRVDSLAGYKLSNGNFGGKVGGFAIFHINKKIFLLSNLSAFFNDQELQLYFSNSSSYIKTQNTFFNLGLSINTSPFSVPLNLGLGLDGGLNLGKTQYSDELKIVNNNFNASLEFRIGYALKKGKLNIAPEVSYAFGLTNVIGTSVIVDRLKLDCFNFTLMFY
jgi:hypothetical protein